MSTRNAHAKNLERPHKHEQPKPGIGASLANAKTIKAEQGGKVGERSKGGVAETYFGNSRAAVHPNFDKHPHD
ncbi:MAG: hypothetical protein ACLPLR_18595 [Terriglobales bacterium]